MKVKFSSRFFDKIERETILLNYSGNLCGGRLPTYFQHGITYSAVNEFVSEMEENKRNSFKNAGTVERIGH
ncbi:hypothetical protein CON65_10400 [Bacillus pseudomycoides]|uniref:Uncharacterized protein n=1 Tax=Bacillus pseudomycoides TaxID=64104 RepID=A0AA91ZTL2_9BACI|nr:hypothetical protein COO03_01925 [Bacillus sp. AFS098217]PED82719.1 hypothetical protein CON65_10400 [Bacillus pseudomycoides]PEU07592.1 hypothetical protein CN524_20350 [Bacillus sp. AFS019443]PEU13113.1 hypothetical protein CN525_20020 [Bacillus sp. AFS014408]PFW61493.1 hypothetical protein COL20_17340 [Bacillus sp. AFS075034]